MRVPAAWLDTTSSFDIALFDQTNIKSFVTRIDRRCMSDSRFFANANQRHKNSFFASFIPIDSDEESEVNSGNATTSGVSTPQFRLVATNETLEELLAKLLEKIDKTGGNSQQNYLEQLLLFLTRNPTLVNRAPKNFHSNPLELIIKIGDFRMAKELLTLRAMVRPENRFLLKRIAHLLERQGVRLNEHDDTREEKPKNRRSVSI